MLIYVRVGGGTGGPCIIGGPNWALAPIPIHCQSPLRLIAFEENPRTPVDTSKRLSIAYASKLLRIYRGSSIGQRSKLAQSVAEKRRWWTLDRHLELARGLAGRYCRRGREVLGGSPSSGRGKAVLVTVLVESADTMLTLPGATSALPHRAEPAFVPRDVPRRTRKQPSSLRRFYSIPRNVRARESRERLALADHWNSRHRVLLRCFALNEKRDESFFRFTELVIEEPGLTDRYSFVVPLTLRTLSWKVWSTSIRNSVFVSECFHGQSSLSPPAKPGAKGHQGPEHRFRNLIRHCGVLSPLGIQPPTPDMVWIHLLVVDPPPRLYLSISARFSERPLYDEDDRDDDGNDDDDDDGDDDDCTIFILSQQDTLGYIQALSKGKDAGTTTTTTTTKNTFALVEDHEERGEDAEEG
ncbi:LOW QUALITY PROTEIN: hypothetical protein V1478_002499, partial [Vespula squamosa]